MPLLETKGAASAQGFGGAGAGSSGPVNYIEDVFSTYLYTGNASSQTITNGIDLAGKGGLVWTKSRTTAGYRNSLSDTVSGIGKQLFSDGTNAQQTASNRIDAVYNNGYLLGSDTYYNTTSNTYVSWTFRKQPKFFDVVTYTGNGSNRTISHNLDSVPGCIIVKRTDTTADWQVYHRSLANTEYMVLNDTAAKATGATRWNSTTPTSTVFSLGTDTTVNASGGTYVAYLFAHNAGGFGLTGSDNVISCGSFTTDGSGNATVSLGYEPQWVMDKVSSSGGDNWIITDIMRGQSLTNINFLFPNLSNAESVAAYGYNIPTATGFNVINHNSNTTYIYIAIRRGPMKVPTSGTSVFAPVVQASASPTLITTNFPVDMSWMRASLASANQIYDLDRLRGNSAYLETATTNAEQTYSGGWNFQSNVGVNDVAWSSSGAIWWNFRRAPGFFDVVCYTGTGSATTQTHNLGVAPELMIIKSRSGAFLWNVYSKDLAAPTDSYLRLDTAGAPTTGVGGLLWNNTAPTASVFSVGNANQINQSTTTYVAYLFATCAGVSKVGSYTGTGALQTINCGFTGGSRFVLIKRTDSTGDWYVYDSARGISSGNDPYLLLNSTAAEVTGTNYVDTDSTGFKVTAAAPAGLNANGGSFVFLAIA